MKIRVWLDKNNPFRPIFVILHRQIWTHTFSSHIFPLACQGLSYCRSQRGHRPHRLSGNKMFGGCVRFTLHMVGALKVDLKT